MRVRLRYIHEFKDRHGVVRRYFRRGGRHIALPGVPGSPEFMAAYNAALAGHQVQRPEIGASRSVAGSMSALIASYYQDNGFLALAPGTQKMRRAIFERFRAEHGHRPVGLMRQRDVAVLLGSMKPFAARNWLKTLRGLMQFAIAREFRHDDPTIGVKPARAVAGRIHTWTEDEIAHYEARHPIGSRARLAMGLLLFTGQRRSDVVRMGPQHVRDGRIAVRQKKTRMEKTDRVLLIPLHPQLAEILSASPPGNLAFLVNKWGRPFSAEGFGNAFREWCHEAGLPPECSSHGLRKAQCRRLAEAGCSAPEIASISGHKTLAEVQRYIEEAEQARLAESAMATVTRAFRTGSETQIGNPSERFAKSAENPK